MPECKWGSLAMGRDDALALALSTQKCDTCHLRLEALK